MSGLKAPSNMTNQSGFGKFKPEVKKEERNNTYFENFTEDLRRGIQDKDAPVLDDIEKNVDTILDTHRDIGNVLMTFTDKLVKVLS